MQRVEGRCGKEGRREGVVEKGKEGGCGGKGGREDSRETNEIKNNQGYDEERQLET